MLKERGDRELWAEKAAGMGMGGWGLVVGRANTLTLLLVIVFPGLAVVGLAALWLALLACAKNTKAVRSLAATWPQPLAWPLTLGPALCWLPRPGHTPLQLNPRPVAQEEGGSR